jgi:hypothetical protein
MRIFFLRPHDRVRVGVEVVTLCLRRQDRVDIDAIAPRPLDRALDEIDAVGPRQPDKAQDDTGAVAPHPSAQAQDDTDVLDPPGPHSVRVAIDATAPRPQYESQVNGTIPAQPWRACSPQCEPQTAPSDALTIHFGRDHCVSATAAAKTKTAMAPIQTIDPAEVVAEVDGAIEILNQSTGTAEVAEEVYGFEIGIEIEIDTQTTTAVYMTLPAATGCMDGLVLRVSLFLLESLGGAGGIVTVVKGLAGVRAVMGVVSRARRPWDRVWRRAC